MSTEKKNQTPALVPLTAEMCQEPFESFLSNVGDFDELAIDLLYVLDDSLEGDCEFAEQNISRYYKLLIFINQLSRIQKGKFWI
jgi:hypothetical protein